MSKRDEFRALHPAGSGPRVVIRKKHGLWWADWSDKFQGCPAQFFDGYADISHEQAVRYAERMWRDRWGAEASHE